MGLTKREFLPETLFISDPDFVVRDYVQAFVDFFGDVTLPAVDAIPEIIRPDETRAIDLLLRNLGNPFRFAGLPEETKRRLGAYLVTIYRKRGTAEGIRMALEFFIEKPVRIVDPQQDESWILGESELGTETFLGPGRDTPNLFTFIVEYDEVLTADEIEMVDPIVNATKPGWTIHVIRHGLDPTPAPLPLVEDFEEWPLG